MAAKSSLRSSLRACQNSLLPIDIHAQSTRLTQLIARHPLFTAASSLAIFLSSPTEINTDHIIQLAFQSGKQCYVPFCASKTTMEMVETTPDDLFALPLNSFGIREHVLPDPSLFLAEPKHLDVIIVPGCAFDSNGGRLGYGRGYYDRFLSRFYKMSDEPGHQRPWLIGICLTQQLIDTVPVDDHDWRVDLVITADGIQYNRKA